MTFAQTSAGVRFAYCAGMGGNPNSAAILLNSPDAFIASNAFWNALNSVVSVFRNASAPAMNLPGQHSNAFCPFKEPVKLVHHADAPPGERGQRCSCHT